MAKITYNFLHIDTFNYKAVEVHGNRYLYNIDEKKWKGGRTLIHIVCPTHGSFKQTATAHIHQKQGCPICGAIKSAKLRTVRFEDFVARARLSKGDRFIYYKDQWKGMETKTIVCCPKHGDIEVLPRVHITNKTGCGLCGYDCVGASRKISINDFKSKANAIFDNKYDYSLIEIKNYKSLLTIICPIHGNFQRVLGKHLMGRGCPKCKKEGQTSNKADAWLDNLNIPSLIKEYRLPERKVRVVDGYDPMTNTVYQFHGDLWHGNPLVYEASEINPLTKEKFGDIFARTKRLDDEIISFGYNLVVQWENGRRKL